MNKPMRYKMFSGFFFLSFFCAPNIYSQTINQQTVKEGIEQLNTNFPQERIYIQFDKPAYAPGETIWYKAYVMSGTEISNISRNIYVDFTDADGIIVLHAMAPLFKLLESCKILKINYL